MLHALAHFGDPPIRQLPARRRGGKWKVVMWGACGLPFNSMHCRNSLRQCHFVTSMTAPIASGWSELPGGACTRWKAPPLHGARRLRPLAARNGAATLGPSRDIPGHAKLVGLPRKRSSARRWTCRRPAHPNLLSSPFASFRSAASKPSVNQL